MEMEKENKNKEYVIKGTVTGICNILKEDFGMEDDEARFFFYVMIGRNDEETINGVDNDELDQWYKETQDEQCKGQILNSRYVISFDEIKREICHAAYRFLVELIFAEEYNLQVIGLDLLYLILSSIKKLDDGDRCVYACIVKLCIDDKKRVFDTTMVKTANRDGNCDYQTNKCNCPYFKPDEGCSCDEEKIKLSFERLEQQNIIQKVGKNWTLVR